MRALVILSFTLLSQIAFASGGSKTLIGRCSYDNLTSDDGSFRKGYVIANFYRVNGEILVAEGVSLVDGSILEHVDNIQVGNQAKFDQGVLWPTYKITLNPKSSALNFSGYWIDNLARELNPSTPTKSTFVYATLKMGQVISSPLIDGSFLQNNLGQPNGYPACVFWESPVAP
jgi:hypothetical protein